MPTIRVDPDVFAGLQKLAQPFVDSPSMVIRRLLEEQGVLKKETRTAKEVKTAQALTPQALYEQYLLLVLLKEFDGRAHKRDVTYAVIRKMMKDGHIGAADQELVKTGETKAENTLTWARNALRTRGLITRAAPRGIWELTPAGRQAASGEQADYVNDR
jgi:hypothetical protein